MKKSYQKPTMLIVAMQPIGSLLTTSLTDKTVGGNADFVYGGGKGDVDARVKENSIWDNEW